MESLVLLDLARAGWMQVIGWRSQPQLLYPHEPAAQTSPLTSQLSVLKDSESQMLSDDGCFFSQGTQLKAGQSSQWGKR